MKPTKETILQVVELYKQWCGEWTEQPLSDYVQEHWEEEDTAEVAANAFTAMLGDPEQDFNDIINEVFGKTFQHKTKKS